MSPSVPNIPDRRLCYSRSTKIRRLYQPSLSQKLTIICKCSQYSTLMNTTTCLVCSRSGGGWSVKEVRSANRLLPGNIIMSISDSTSAQSIGLQRWIREQSLETWREDPCLVTAIYLYNLTAPGEWCQLFWECSTAETATRLKEKLKSSDLSGTYLISRCLSGLTPSEIDYYYCQEIQA